MQESCYLSNLLCSRRNSAKDCKNQTCSYEFQKLNWIIFISIGRLSDELWVLSMSEPGQNFDCWANRDRPQQFFHLVEHIGQKSCMRSLDLILKFFLDCLLSLFDTVSDRVWVSAFFIPPQDSQGRVSTVPLVQLFKREIKRALWHTLHQTLLWLPTRSILGKLTPRNGSHFLGVSAVFPPSMVQLDCLRDESSRVWVQYALKTWSGNRIVRIGSTHLRWCVFWLGSGSGKSVLPNLSFSQELCIFIWL